MKPFYQVLVVHTLHGTDPSLTHGEYLYANMTSHIFDNLSLAEECFHEFSALYEGMSAMTVELNTLEGSDDSDNS